MSPCAQSSTSQARGETVERARTNLVEALELFFESADPTEIARRLHNEVFVTRVEVLFES
jgi:predicted RNase H-like HicB family nuclease